MDVAVIWLGAAYTGLLATAVGFVLWRLIFRKKFSLFTLSFLILPVGQLFTLHSFRFDTWSWFWVVGVFFGLSANILLVVFAILQEKKASAEKELQEARHRMELEKSHYEAAGKRRVQLAEIRRDFDERLKTALVRGAEAFDNIGLASQADFTYCVIPVVNAVLTEKQKICEASGIVLSVDINIPKSLVVSPIHLCSIFGNILDNAISACKKVKTDKPVIRLASMMQGDYLFITVTNPSDVPQNINPPGYGLRILTELANRYGGDFQSQYSAGMFTSFVSLLAVEGEVNERDFC